MSPAKKRRKRICSRPPRKGTKRYYALHGVGRMMRNSSIMGTVGNRQYVGMMMRKFLGRRGKR